MPPDPQRLPMFPLSTVLFPYAPLPLQVFEPRYQALVTDCLRGSGEFGVVLIARGSEVGGGDQRVAVGTVARIELASPLPGGRWGLLARGTPRRIRVAEWLPDDPYPSAMIEELSPPARSPSPPPGTLPAGHAAGLTAPGTPDPDPDPGTPAPAGAAGLAEALAAIRRARALLSETGRAPALAAGLELDGDPEVAAWQVCALAPVTPFDAQRLLEHDDPAARLAEVADLSAAVADDLSRLLAGGTA